MSTTYISNELQLYQILDSESSRVNLDAEAPDYDAFVPETRPRGARQAMLLGRGGSSASFRGSFSEIMVAKEEKKQQEEENLMFEALYPSAPGPAAHLVNEQTKYFDNPLCADSEEPYATVDPDAEPNRRTFSVRLLKMFKNPSSTLGESISKNNKDENEGLSHRSFSIRFKTSSSTWNESVNKNKDENDAMQRRSFSVRFLSRKSSNFSSFSNNKARPDSSSSSQEDSASSRNDRQSTFSRTSNVKEQQNVRSSFRLNRRSLLKRVTG